MEYILKYEQRMIQRYVVMAAGMLVHAKFVSRILLEPLYNRTSRTLVKRALSERKAVKDIIGGKMEGRHGRSSTT